MNSFFEVFVSKDQLEATVSLRDDIPTDFQISKEDFLDFLRERKIVFGLKAEAIECIISHPLEMDYPIVVAEGILPQNGTSGYLINKAVVEKEPESDVGNKAFNLKNVMKINSVKSGQLLAEIVQPTIGIPGKSVYGIPIPAKNGRPLTLRPGKNVIYHLNNVFATIDGQISIKPNTINVFPVFEVDGDLDLKTGNIDFIGNVIIHGNVPSGYTIKAGGDIRVDGLVEGAELIAGGSIAISGGIAGANRGYVEAGVGIQSSYLNQANCKAGQEIVVDSSILHSQIECSGSVICRKGHIIGGKITAFKHVEAADIGNYHYMQTLLFIGQPNNHMDEENKIIFTYIKNIIYAIE